MGMLSKGYMGNILRINVSTGTARVEPLPDELARQLRLPAGLKAELETQAKAA
jgi:aldehyde:ferredoxin oxidoreductase